METVFGEQDLDPERKQRTRTEIENDFFYKADDIKEQLRLYELRKNFLVHEDKKYEEFWSKYGTTTEKSSSADQTKGMLVEPYLRPVFDPNNSAHTQFFSKPHEERDTSYEDGMVYAAIDCFGKKTERRVCPHCHNLLPGSSYGRYPVTFISVIGVTRAGKTVFLSQMCRTFGNKLANLGIVANPMSTAARLYVDENPVKEGKKLPEGTPPKTLLQPLCFELAYRENGGLRRQTVVFFDIAGENCVPPDSKESVDYNMRNFGPFVENSHAIMLVIHPEQLRHNDDTYESVAVLNTIHAVFEKKFDGGSIPVPIAVCVSKGDLIVEELGFSELSDIVFAADKNGKVLPAFNAEDYNQIHDAIQGYIEMSDSELCSQLYILYDNYNYFVFSALGTGTKKIEGTDFETPASTVAPVRVMEPVLWLFKKLGFVKSHGVTHEAEDWICDTCGWRCRVGDKYCPVCKTNNEGEWECPGGHGVQTGEWCSAPHCRYNKDGEKRGLFGRK